MLPIFVLLLGGKSEAYADRDHTRKVVDTLNFAGDSIAVNMQN
jgi:hypothetical protein